MDSMFDALVAEYGELSLLSMSIHNNGFTYCNNVKDGSLNSKVLAVSYEGEMSPIDSNGVFYGVSVIMRECIAKYGTPNRARTIKVDDGLVEIIYRDIREFSIIKFDDGEVVGLLNKVNDDTVVIIRMSGWVGSSLITELFRNRDWEITNKFDSIIDVMMCLQSLPIEN